VNPTNVFLDAHHGVRAHYSPDVGQQVASLATAQELAFVRGIGIAERYAHEESIELRFGQLVGAELLVRVLRRDDEERVRQAVGGKVCAHLALFHGLQQRALRPGARAVHLIGEQKLRKDRALPEMKLLAGAIEDRNADDVGREQIARELHPLPCQPQHMSESVSQRCFSDAGHVLDEQVTACQQASEAQAHLSRLPEDDRFQGLHRAP